MKEPHLGSSYTITWRSWCVSGIRAIGSSLVADQGTITILIWSSVLHVSPFVLLWVNANSWSSDSWTQLSLSSSKTVFKSLMCRRKEGEPKRFLYKTPALTSHHKVLLSPCIEFGQSILTICQENLCLTASEHELCGRPDQMLMKMKEQYPGCVFWSFQVMQPYIDQFNEVIDSSRAFSCFSLMAIMDVLVHLHHPVSNVTPGTSGQGWYEGNMPHVLPL